MWCWISFFQCNISVPYAEVIGSAATETFFPYVTGDATDLLVAVDWCLVVAHSA